MKPKLVAFMAVFMIAFSFCAASALKADRHDCPPPQPAILDGGSAELCGLPATTPVQTIQDPADWGPFPRGWKSYDLLVNFKSQDFFPYRNTSRWICGNDSLDEGVIRAHIYYPANHGFDLERDATLAVGDQKFPLLIFVHGAGAPHDGFNYALERIVSQGAIVVALRGFLDATPTNEGSAGDDVEFIECRVRAILLHLRFLRHLAFDEEVGFKSGLGRAFANRLDISRIGLIGWSRGGESVLIAALRQKSDSLTFDPFQIRGIFALAPTRTHPETDHARLTLEVPWFGLSGAGDPILGAAISTYDRLEAPAGKTLAVLTSAAHGWLEPGISEINKPLATTLVATFVRRHIFGERSGVLGKILEGKTETNNIAIHDVRWLFESGPTIPIETFSNPPEGENDTGGMNVESRGIVVSSEMDLRASAGDLKLYTGRALSFDWRSNLTEYLFRAGDPDFASFAGTSNTLSFQLARRDNDDPRSSNVSIGLRDSCGQEHFIRVRPIKPRSLSNTIFETREVQLTCFNRAVFMERLSEIVLRVESPPTGSMAVRAISLRRK